MTAPAVIDEIVERFEDNLKTGKLNQCKATQLRSEFIDPFFEALGWVIGSKQSLFGSCKAIGYRVEIAAGQMSIAPDYCFRIDGRPVFFLMIGKPLVDDDSKSDIHLAYHLRRYAWSAKLPLSILTDFKNFAVYDCRPKPGQRDEPTNGRIICWGYTEYGLKWAEISAIFSRPAVLEGSIEKFVGSIKKKRSWVAVDGSLLSEIECWQTRLADNIVLHNPNLAQEDVNVAVRRIIDGLIFLRFAEARGIEPQGQLYDLLHCSQVYPRLCDIFQQASDRYPGRLFPGGRGKKEKNGRLDQVVALASALVIDDGALKTILKQLYYPDSPYEFSVLPESILGQVYEHFLGKKIQLTSARQAELVDKPGVNKSGGIYYTPAYIVDYIVKQTVGRLIKDNRLRSRELSTKLKIFDPACGSGSFLLGAYQFLLDWYLTQYVKKTDRWATGRRPRLWQTADHDWQLTISERKRILLDHIYGLDIDPRAVEVAKLSLLLKALTGEEEQTKQLSLFQKKAQINLAKNIRCGNLLIGPDFYDKQQKLLFKDSASQISMFDLPTEFSEIASEGGFDVVIGNPPYIPLQSLNLPGMEAYLRCHYLSAVYKVDTYQVFLEKACQITKQHGLVGFITPNTFLKNRFALELRKYLLDHSEIMEINLFDYRVFQKIGIDATIIIFRKTDNPALDHSIIVNRVKKDFKFKYIGTRPQSEWQKQENLNFDLPDSETEQILINKIDKISARLGSFATAYFGIQTHGRAKYVCSKTIDSRWKPVLDGANINRYRLSRPTEYVCLKPEAIKSGGKIQVYERARLGVRQIGRRPIATKLPAGWYTLNTVYNIYFTKKVGYKLEYILGLISSNLLGWYWQRRYFDQKRIFPKIKKAPLLAIPIRFIDFNDLKDKARHDRIVRLVRRMLGLNRQLTTAKDLSKVKTSFLPQIVDTDRQIDRAVYELYDLNQTEIKIVEENLSLEAN